jgi:Ca2+-binding RTX toxin-like protein
VWGRLAALVCLCLLAATADGSAQSEPTCFGAAATIVGTQGDDQIIGTPGPDVIVTLGGSDSVIGLAGDDRICLGDGNDIVLPGAGNDMIDGGPGDSDGVTYDDATGPMHIDLQAGVATGGSGSDTLTGIEDAGGSPFDDTLLGDANINVLFGEGGNDTLDGRAHSDALDGEAGNDTLIGHAGDGDAAAYLDTPTGVNVDLASGVATGDGRDSLTDVEGVIGSPHNDTIAGNEGLNFLMGFGGNDTVDGRGGFDIADFVDQVNASLVTNTATSNGTEKLRNIEGLAGSATGNDHLVGNGKQNFLEGYGGNDVLSGGGGPDVIFGDEGDDRIAGGTGDDKLFGGPGTDTLNGGAGTTDVVSYINAAAGVRADLATHTASGGDGSDTLTSVEGVSGSSFADTLVGDGKPNELFGNEGNDTLSAGGGADFVGGGAGTDSIQGGAGKDYCLDTQATPGCEITGAPDVPGSPPPPPVPARALALAGAPSVASAPMQQNGNVLAWMARTIPRLHRAFAALDAHRLVDPLISNPPTVRTAPAVSETADYEYSAEPLCIATKRGGTTDIAPPNVVHPVGNDDKPEEAWWQGTLYRQRGKSGPFTKLQAKTGWARAQLAGNIVLPGGVVVWKDASGRRAFRSPIGVTVPHGRYVWKGQIYWVRSGGRIFAPVEPHIIQARTIRHNKNCDFG